MRMDPKPPWKELSKVDALWIIQFLDWPLSRHNKDRLSGKQYVSARKHLQGMDLVVPVDQDPTPPPVVYPRYIFVYPPSQSKGAKKLNLDYEFEIDRKRRRVWYCLKIIKPLPTTAKEIAALLV